MKPYLLLFLFPLLFSCSDSHRPPSASQEWFSDNGHLKVLTTTAMIANLVEEIGGDQVDVTTLIQGDLDPHSYQLVKGDDEKLQFAEVIFYNGLGLEHGASTRRYLQTSHRAVPLGNLILASEPDALIYVDQTIDPHIWMDISLWAKTIPYIVATLSEYDPTHKHLFEERGKSLTKKLEDSHSNARSLLQSLPAEKRYLVTSHDAFHYFTRAYLASEGEETMEQWHPRVAAPEGLSPESQISPHDIREIIDHMKKHAITVIFPESNVSRDSLKKIMLAGKEMGLDVVLAEDSLYGDAMGPPGSSGENYLKMVNHNATTIHHYLQQ